MKSSSIFRKLCLRWLIGDRMDKVIENLIINASRSDEQEARNVDDRGRHN